MCLLATTFACAGEFVLKTFALGRDVACPRHDEFAEKERPPNRQVAGGGLNRITGRRSEDPVMPYADRINAQDGIDSNQ